MRIMTPVQKASGLALLAGLGLGVSALLFQGCGGGNSGLTPTPNAGTQLALPTGLDGNAPATTMGSPARSGNTASASITIVWPTRPKGYVTPRVVPIAANTIAVDVKQRGTTIDEKLAIRPVSGNQTVVFFDRLPADSLLIKATAYPGVHAKAGAILATGEATVTTRAGARVNVTVTMTTAIHGLAISPPDPVVLVGPTHAILLTATALNAQGQVVPTVSNTLRWSTKDVTIAKINPNGNPAGKAALEGIKPGITDVTVTDIESHQTGKTTVTVVSPLAHVDVAPASPTVAVGGIATLTATKRDAAGNALPVPAANFRWTVANPAIATVSATGNPATVHGVSAGSTQVTVTDIESLQTGKATVTVVLPLAHVDVAPAGATVAPGVIAELTATKRDAAGNALPVPPANFSWTVANPAIATVSSAASNHAIVMGVSAGSTQVTVTESQSGLQATVTVQVRSACVANAGHDCCPGTGCSPGDFTIQCDGSCMFTAPH